MSWFRVKTSCVAGKDSQATRIAPRRLPVQERGEAKVALILEATLLLIEEQGVRAVTTNAVARRAGIPVGSLYQFFPNKHAVLYALACQQLQTFNDSFVEFIEDSAPVTSIGEIVSQVIDKLRDSYLRIPGLFALLSADFAHPDLQRLFKDNNLRVAELVTAIFISRGALPRCTDFEHVALVAVEAADGVLKRWIQGGGKDDVLLLEVKELVTSYFESRLLLPAIR